MFFQGKEINSYKLLDDQISEEMSHMNTVENDLNFLPFGQDY